MMSSLEKYDAELCSKRNVVQSRSLTEPKNIIWQPAEPNKYSCIPLQQGLQGCTDKRTRGKITAKCLYSASILLLNPASIVIIFSIFSYGTIHTKITNEKHNGCMASDHGNFGSGGCKTEFGASNICKSRQDDPPDADIKGCLTGLKQSLL